MVTVNRWTFDDGAGTTYTVPINPNTMSKLRAARAISTKVTTAVNGQALFFEGQRPPQQFTFAGTLIDKAHYDALDWWVYNTGRITITDHFKRVLSVVLVDFEAVPKYTTQYYWRHDYTVTGICYDIDASNAITGPGSGSGGGTAPGGNTGGGTTPAVVTPTVTPLPALGDAVQRVAVPYYAYPAWYTTGSEWNRMRADAPYVDVVVVNPASGPGSSINTDYVTAIREAQASGIRVLGYVDAGYPGSATEVPLATAKADIDKWYAWYGIDGIFLDEMSYQAANVAWCQQAFAYIRSKGGLVIINPGTQYVEEAYMPYCDVVMNYESYASSYLTQTLASFPAWTQNYPASRFWHCIHDAATTAVRDQVIAQSKTLRAGHIYVTDGQFSTGNPYSRIPSDPYFSGTVAAIR